MRAAKATGQKKKLPKANPPRHHTPSSLSSGSEQRRQVMFRLMEQLSAVSSQLAAARLIAEATDKIFAWDAFNLNQYQPESQSVKAVLSIDFLDGARREVPPSNPDSRPSKMAQTIIAHGAKLILREGANRESMEAAPFGDKSRRSVSLMYAPVHCGTRVIGILSVQSYRAQAWSPGDLDLLQAIADLCAGAIGRLDAEQSLIENEARLALAQSVAGLGSFDVDLSTGHTVWSLELYCLWNREPRLGPMSRDEVFAAMHPEDSLRLRPVYEQFLIEGDTYEGSYRVLNADGSLRHVHSKAKIIRDAQGRRVRVIGAVQDITEQVQAEQSIRESAHRLAEAQAVAHVGSYEFNVRTGARHWSAETYRLCGRDPRLGPRQPAEVLEMIHPDDRDRFSAAMKRTLQEGAPMEEDFRIELPDGTWRHLFAKAAVTHDADGRPLKITGTVQDVTERKRAEAALRKSETQYRQLVELAQEGIWSIDAANLTTYANPRMAEMLGYTMEQMLGKPLFDFMDDRGIEICKRNVDRRRQGIAEEHEFEFIRQDGRRIITSMNTSPITDSAGTYCGAIAGVADITERKQAEEALRLHSAVLLNMSDAILITDHDETIIDCNPAAEQLFGYPVAELVGHLPTLLHRPAERPTLMQAVRSGVLGQGFWRGEICFVRKNGSEGHCDTVCVPLRNDRGEHIATISVNRDITEQRQLKQQILEIGDLERDRIGQDLHDGLCQQLISVAFAANQLTRQLKGRAGPARAVAQDIAESLDDAITHARQIARGLYPVSLQAGGLPSALQELATQVKQRSQMNCAVDADEAITINDPTAATHLFRIAQESVNNAVKHARARHIVIRLKQTNERLELSVADDGGGLPTEERRADAMGMQILEYRSGAIGAKLEIESQPGSGTTVRCSVPLKAIK